MVLMLWGVKDSRVKLILLLLLLLDGGGGSYSGGCGSAKVWNQVKHGAGCEKALFPDTF
jgi:hypothetical protein